MNVNIACSCSDSVNHSKECACKHEDDGRIFWILDSGTSTHFTPHHSDFIDYVELKGDDHIPVQTAGSIIHVTGHGHMLIQWMDHVHKQSHLLDLHGTWHIPNLDVHLISLGQLLNHGAKVQGNMHQINVLYSDGILLAPFTPGHLGSNMYTLESLPLKGLTMTCTLTYDIVYCYLGHPSKDMICHACKHMWNFPDIEILNMDSICLLQFSSWLVLFSLFLLFMPHLPSQGPFLTPIITIFLSWDLSHSLYVPSNPYTILGIIAGQGIFFASLFLVMDTYFSSRFSRIGYVFLLLIFLSMIFHDFLPLLSRTFYLVPQYSFAYSAGLCLSI